MINRGPLLDIFNAALAAADPYRAVARAMRIENGMLAAGGCVYDLNVFDRIMVVGAGKATAAMAAAVEDTLGNRTDSGVIVVKYGHAAGKLRAIEQVEAAHPVPDEAGVWGATPFANILIVGTRTAGRADCGRSRGGKVENYVRGSTSVDVREHEAEDGATR